MHDHQKTEFKRSTQLRKYLPGAALTLLTLFLMIFFKYNKQEINTIIEKGKGNLVEFYTQNLKPLLFKSDISNEDVFNFALYQNLPVDKTEKKVLQINEETSGYDIFTVQPTIFRESTNNYEKFRQNLNLNEEQKMQIDSILESYKNELYSSILVNENNAIAVNPRIIDLRKAIITDIALFAKNVNDKRSDKFPQLDFDLNLGNTDDFNQVIKLAKSTADDDFIFITPDTVFARECEFNREAMLEELAYARTDYKKALEKLNDLKINVSLDKMALRFALDSLIAEKIHFQIDTIRSIVALQKSQTKVDTELKKLNLNLANVDKILRSFSYKIKDNSKENGEIDKDYDSDWEMDPGFEININVDSIVSSSLKLIEGIDLRNLENLEIDIDSLIEVYHSFPIDSIRITPPDKIKIPKERN